MSDLAPSNSLTLRPLWRWLAGVLGCALLLLIFVGFEVARSINGYYFKDYSFPTTSVYDIAGVLAALYLVLVAVTGRFRLAKVASSSR